MLSLRNIVVHYGGVQAVKDVSLEVTEHAITGLIGGNGAGKSTTLRAISGLVPLTSGEIWFEGRRIDGLAPEKIFEMGIVHVPEGKKLFLEMSILDNLLAGAYLRKDPDHLGTDLDRIFEYFPVLGEARHRPASSLSGGEQQMLAIARGLMAGPRVLMLDEPSLGLSPLLIKEVGRIIGRIAGEGVPILLVEQNASLAFQLAHNIYVMEIGAITLAGDPKNLQDNPHVKEAYLGMAVSEIPSFCAVPQVGKPTVVTVARESEARWQDKSPQGRWQDRTPTGSGEKTQPKELAGKIDRLRAGDSSKIVTPQANTFERTPEKRADGARWPGEVAEVSISSTPLDVTERWAPKSKEAERVAAAASPERVSLEPPPRERLGGKRWPEERRPKPPKTPVRIVKKRSVPQITSLKKGTV
jgi:branched-chain amino acid transport system ATP-binding protein